MSNVKGIEKHQLVVFFVVDTSDGMAGTLIGTVNTAIREFLPEIRKLSNSAVIIKVAVLAFSSGAYWVTKDGPVEIEKFQWNDLEAAGSADFGLACKTLNEKLSRKAFMSGTRYSHPVIFLCSCSRPTDDWQSGIAELKQNRWFCHSVKVALPIGDSADVDILTEFTGTREAVLFVHTPEALIKWIRYTYEDDICVEPIRSRDIGLNEIAEEIKSLSGRLQDLTKELGALGDSVQMKVKEQQLNDALSSTMISLDSAQEDNWE